jgi:hypothetical protein
VSTVVLVLLVVTLAGIGGAVPDACAPPGQPASAVDAADEDGLTALMKAAARGERAQVAALLARGADPNVRTPVQRITALMCAAYFGHRNVIDTLVAGGARIELKDAQGAAAVDWAALGDHPELERVLTGPNAALNPFLNTGLMPIWLMDKAAGRD